MFLHLPIAMMAMLSPIAVSDTVPSFSIVRECRFEGESTVAFDRCSKDETEARQRLEAEWAQFVAADKSTCIVELTIGGFASYVDLLTCLEMSNEVRNPRRINPELRLQMKSRSRWDRGSLKQQSAMDTVRNSRAHP